MAKPTIELSISKKPTDVELKKLKEYFKEMPVEEILSGLKFAKNRWSAKDAGTLKVSRETSGRTNGAVDLPAWRAVEVDTSACMSVVNSVRRRTLLMLSGVILEILGLIAIVAILVYLQRLLPLSKPLIVWALFGLGVSITSVVFKIRNSIGLWRSEAESTSDMLKLSEQRLQAIARTNRFSRRLTLVFAIVLPVWIAVVLFHGPQRGTHECLTDREGGPIAEHRRAEGHVVIGVRDQAGRATTIRNGEKTIDG